MSRFKCKLAVVTASSAGIGLAIAERFLEEEASVVISSRKEEHVERALQYLKSKGHTKITGTVCAVNNPKHRVSLLNFAINAFPGYSRIDILVSNAACSPFMGLTTDTPESAYDKLFEINVRISMPLCP